MQFILEKCWVFTCSGLLTILAVCDPPSGPWVAQKTDQRYITSREKGVDKEALAGLGVFLIVALGRCVAVVLPSPRKMASALCWYTPIPNAL